MSVDPISECLPGIADHLLTVSMPALGGDLTRVRERHLSDAVREVVGRHLKTTVVSTVVKVPEWPRLGQSGTDFVVDWPPGSRRFRHVGELKWCQIGHDKVYEAIWDLFKMALVSRQPGVRTAHLITGAPAEMWPIAFCGDLFDGGTFSSDELCARRFGVGSKRLAWDYLLEGGYDRYPDRVPAEITATPVHEPVAIRVDEHTWELRVVAVSTTVRRDDMPFEGGWPRGLRPPDARRPSP